MQSLASRTLLCGELRDSGGLSRGFLFGSGSTVAWSDLVRGSILGGRIEDLRGRSVLVTTTDQLTAALAIVELDGVASRLVLCPPDLPARYLSFVIDSAGVDAVVSDQRSQQRTLEPGARVVETFVTCSPEVAPTGSDHRESHLTEWVLLTSGTTGAPKLVVHTLASLVGAIEAPSTSKSPVVWSTFYDIRRFGGLQIFLRAALSGASLVLSSAHESIADFLARAGSRGVTHISGTPSHWRRALMSSSAYMIAPQYVRLSGEIADQAILNQLKSFYPQARLSHAFATTEAGVAFDVKDGVAGFPEDVLDHTPDVEMKVEQSSLRIRSSRTATRYLGGTGQILKDADGFVDTSDILELRDGRYQFVGRRDGIINVGGSKVYPEEVEAVINTHPQVQISVVRSKKNSLTGALVVADIVLKTEQHDAGSDASELRGEILHLCREALAPYKVPTSIHFVSAFALAETGKLMRRHA